ncbi:MAG TPA: GMC family oxidoreductase N-terminal domain-containing protein [Candidatus Acidoferrum sp.]|nr:GMC family oxidoreductase N-terminal domain-containing protein [Candidatus Acidoferrum sp.]
MQGRSVRQVKLALWALELYPFPWRFSRASIDARQDFLLRLEGSSLPFASDLLLFLKVLAGLGYGNDPRVRAAVGYEMRCEVDAADVEAEPNPAGLGDLRPPLGGEDCDVAIVGSGAGGAVTAAILAESGLDVVVLEAGPYLDRRSYPEEPLAALSALYRDGGLTIAEGRPAIPTPVGRAVGGTTVINSGTCFRAPDHVLAGWQAEHGIAWAADLDADYAAAEAMLHVRPVDPERMGRNGQLLREGAEALGVRHEPLRRNAGSCFQCSSCPAGCRLDAKQAMHVSYLPRAVAAGARVRSGVEARRLILAGSRASSLECVARANGRARAFEVHARRAIVLAGGALGTPELLLRSGFRSPSGELGRNLRIHPACWVGARFDEEVRGWDGVMQSYAVSEWEERGILLEATFTPLAFGAQWLPGTGAQHAERVLAYDRIASTGVHLSDRSAGRVGVTGDGSLRVTYGLTDGDASRLVFGIARAAELFYAAGAREVYPQIAGIPTIPRERIADLEASPPPASRLRLEAFHPMGTARMDADAARGVVGTDGAVHDAEALYVADGSLLPSSIGVNPMMTIIAMASRVAHQLADRLN